MEKYIYLVSDGTAITCERVLEAALKQFKTPNLKTKKFPGVRTVADVDSIVESAAKDNALIMYSTVVPELKLSFQIACMDHNIASIDVLGPIVSQLSSILNIAPLSEPGLLEHQKNQIEKMDAVSFSIQHDDGLCTENIIEADVVLIGIPGTLKTPISMYLSCKGIKSANLPILFNEELPAELSKIDSKKIIALTVDIETLTVLRSHKREKDSSHSTMRDGEYMPIEKLKQELEHSNRIIKNKGYKTISITGKSIEDLAKEIIAITKRN